MQKAKQSFQEQLAVVAPVVPKIIRGVNMPDLNDIGVDGVDHINIHPEAETTMGKALDRLADLPFTHPVHGKFRTIEGFWHFIRSQNKDQNLRMYVGLKARIMGENIPTDYVEDFRMIIAAANWEKIKAYPALMEEFKNCHLNIDGYYVRHDTKMRQRPPSSIWYIPGLQEIRIALQEGREPDFDFLTDRMQGIMKRVKPVSLKSVYGQKQETTKPKENVRKKSFLEKPAVKKQKNAAVQETIAQDTAQTIVSLPVVSSDDLVLTQSDIKENLISDESSLVNEETQKEQTVLSEPVVENIVTDDTPQAEAL